MIAAHDTPAPPEETQKGDESDKKQEMERVQEEAAQERDEGGYQ
jgi:hypothetical protein